MIKNTKIREFFKLSLNKIFNYSITGNPKGLSKISYIDLHSF